jgi:hypothetical protein
MAKARPQTRTLPRPAERDRAQTQADPAFGAQAGEVLRRTALGLTAALLVARAFWASESAADGTGRAWIVAMLAAAAIGIAGALVSGTVRLRLSWADAAFFALVALVAFSADRAADRRPALNMAWEWIALGVAYLLVRNLPRTAAEASALAACLVATAVALSAYGLAQVSVEFPEMHRAFLRDPSAALQAAGLDPNMDRNGPEFLHFRDRLLGSNEPFATFALANSLAGFLVGPAVLALAVALDRLRDGKDRPPLAAWLLGAVPALVLLACLVLTKSRSAYLGLLVGGLIAAAQVIGSVPRRWLYLGVGWLVFLVGLIVVAGVATRQLDVQVLTESTKSLRYRVEYWRGTMGVLGEGSRWWTGVGPGNFREAYLKHKLPESSEEIQDPHNFLLDVWASAGLLAVLALVATLVLAARDIFGPPREVPDVEDDEDSPAPPARAGWLIACGFGGWVLAWPLGNLNPFDDMLIGGLPLRWVVLALGWLGAIALGWTFWGRRPVPAWGLGAAVAAVVVNLLAAGGIGFPVVALALWVPIALGLDLRVDRPCGRPRRWGSYVTAFVMAAVLAAAFGWFWGSVLAPTSSAEAHLQMARAALKKKPPDLIRARQLYHEAAERDRYAPGPWIELALFDLELSEARGEAPTDKEVAEIANHALSALEPPRNPESYDVLLKRAQVLSLLIDRLSRSSTPNKGTIAQLKKQRNDTLRGALARYPTNVRLHARLAAALADAGDHKGAVAEAAEALRLDVLVPHAEKKLPDRAQMEALRETWAGQK